MIRRARYPLTLRLAWIESELAHAAKLAALLVKDVPAVRDQAREAAARVAMLAHILSALLVAVGVDAELLGDWLEEMEATGDVEAADELSSEIVAQLLLAGRPVEGEG